jgi:hypothetical protein
MARIETKTFFYSNIFFDKLKIGGTQRNQPEKWNPYDCSSINIGK